MVFYLKDHVKIGCDHASLCKFVYSVTKKDRVNNWWEEIHAITSYKAFEDIKGDNILADGLSRLKALGLYEANASKKLGSKYGKSILVTEYEVISDINIRQCSNKEFEIKGIK